MRTSRACVTLEDVDVECTHCGVRMATHTGSGGTVRYFNCPSCQRWVTSQYTEVFRADAEPRGIQMAKYMFLTEEWVDAAKAIREEHAGDAPAPAHIVRMNQIITEVPFSDDPIHAHMDTSDEHIGSTPMNPASRGTSRS